LGNILNGYKCRSGHILHVGIPNNEQMYKGCQVRVGYGDQHEVYTLTYLTRQHRGVAQGLHPTGPPKYIASWDHSATFTETSSLQRCVDVALRIKYAANEQTTNELLPRLMEFSVAAAADAMGGCASKTKGKRRLQSFAFLYNQWLHSSKLSKKL